MCLRVYLCLRRKLESLASNYFGLTIAPKSWLHWAALIPCWIPNDIDWKILKNLKSCPKAVLLWDCLHSRVCIDHHWPQYPAQVPSPHFRYPENNAGIQEVDIYLRLVDADYSLCSVYFIILLGNSAVYPYSKLCRSVSKKAKHTVPPCCSRPFQKQTCSWSAQGPKVVLQCKDSHDLRPAFPGFKARAALLFNSLKRLKSSLQDGSYCFRS